jgi:WD40 repeat protein
MAFKIIILFFIIVINKVNMNNIILTGHFSYIYSIVYLKDGKLASASEDKTVRIWQSNTNNSWNTINILNGHLDAVTCLAELDDSSLASGSSDGTIRIWNTSNGQTIKTLVGKKDHVGHILSLAVLKNGNLASGSFIKSVILIWDVINGNLIRTIYSYSFFSIYSLVALNDGSLASGADNNIIQIIDPNTGNTIKNITDGTGPLAVLADGRLVSGSKNNDIKIWNIETNSVDVFFKSPSLIVSFAVFTNDFLAFGNLDGTFQILDLENSSILTNSKNQNMVGSLTFLPDGSLVSTDGNILKVWINNSAFLLKINQYFYINLLVLLLYFYIIN